MIHYNFGFLLSCKNVATFTSELKYIEYLLLTHDNSFVFLLDVVDPDVSRVLPSNLERIVIFPSDSDDSVWKKAFEYMISQQLSFRVIFYQIMKTSEVTPHLPPFVTLSNYQMISTDRQQKKYIEQKMKELPNEKYEMLQSLTRETTFYQIDYPIFVYNDILNMIVIKLRTSLANMLNLVDEHDFGDQNHQFKQSVHGLLGLTNDLIDVMTFSSDKLKLELSLFKINYLMEDCVQLIKSSPEFKSKQLNLKKKINNNVCNFNYCHDYRKIKQILINLLNNAVKFTTVGGITFSVKKYQTKYNCPFPLENKPEDYLLFIIKDTGCGISENGQTTINAILNLNTHSTDNWQFQLDPNRDFNPVKKYHFKSLSLFISDKLSRFLHGHIWYKSELDVGTIFYFLLGGSTPPP